MIPLSPSRRWTLAPGGFYDSDTVDLSNLIPGELMIAMLATRASNIVIDTPPGWTLHASLGGAGNDSPALFIWSAIAEPALAGQTTWWAGDGTPAGMDGSKMLVVESYALVRDPTFGPAEGSATSGAGATEALDPAPLGANRPFFRLAVAACAVRDAISDSAGPGWPGPHGAWAERNAFNEVWLLGGAGLLHPAEPVTSALFTWTGPQRARAWVGAWNVISPRRRRSCRATTGGM